MFDVLVNAQFVHVTFLAAGKTKLVQAVCKAAGCTLLSVTNSDLLSRWFGKCESSRWFITICVVREWFIFRRKREKDQNAVWASKKIRAMRNFSRRDRQVRFFLWWLASNGDFNLRVLVTFNSQHRGFKGEKWRFFDKKGSDRTSRANIGNSSTGASYYRGRNESLVSDTLTSKTVLNL